MNNNLPIAFITGASAGIGLELAHRLHDSGYNLVITARREERLADLKTKLEQKRENSVQYLLGDLIDKDFVHRLEGYLQEQRIDLLVNNAGFGTFGEFSSIDSNHEEKMILLNCVAPMRLTRAVVPQMKLRKSGAIVTVSSLAALQPLPYMSTYSATKAFDLFFSLALRAELQKSGIKVIAICPGQTSTEFGTVARGPNDDLGPESDKVESVVGDILVAISRNDSFAVCGRRSKILYTLMRFIPLGLRTQYMEKIIRKGLRESEKC